MTEPQNQETVKTPEGVDAQAQGNATEKKLEELLKKQAEQDRKITELQAEKQALEARNEEIRRHQVSTQTPAPNPDADLDRTLAEALNDSAIGNTEQAATKLRNTFNNALTASQAQAVQQAISQVESKLRLERHVEKRKTEKPYLAKYEKDIARDAFIRFQERSMRGERPSMESVFDESVADFDKRRDEDFKSLQGASPAPTGSQGERSSGGARPDVTVKVEREGEEPSDYIAQRKQALQNREKTRTK